MKLFIFQDCDEVSNNYHRGGSVVAIAESMEEAWRSLAPTTERVFKGKSQTSYWTYELEGHHEPKVWRFPNAGCC